MNILPLEPSLFLAFSIFIGLTLSVLFNLADKIKPFDPNVLLPLLLKIGLASIIIIVIIAWLDKDLAKALSPTLIVISAFIASASVMKSIDAQKKLEKDKNDRLKLRNKSILIINLESLSKEINDQLEYLRSTPIDELNNYKYSDHLNDQLIFRVVEKVTGLEINEYNSYETIKEIDNIKKEVFTRIHSFEVLFKKLKQIDSSKLESSVKSIIRTNCDKYFQTITDNKKFQQLTNNTYTQVYSHETSSGLPHASQNDVALLLKLFFEIKTIVDTLTNNLDKDRIRIDLFIEKLNNDD